MGSHAISWLVKQYRCVLGRMRVHEYLERHPTVARTGGAKRRATYGERMKLEQLEDRVFLSVAGVPNWTEQGPGPITGAQVAGIPNQPVTGAVTSIATHPTNANIIWVGTAGGGIWKTTDGGTTWTPKTDQYPSLAITSLALDPTNNNVLWAGTGVASSSGSAGRTLGMLKSIDGGESWRIQKSIFGGRNRTVRTVLPTRVSQGSGGHVVLAGGDSTPQFTGAPANRISGGLIRSTDGGFGGFSKISGNKNDGLDNDGDHAKDEADEDTGLPGGNITDLKGDPGATAADQSRFYTALINPASAGDNGVYRSDNDGRNWVSLNAALTAAGASLNISTRIRLSVSEAADAVTGNRPVYAAIIQPIQGFAGGGGAAGTNQIVVSAATLIGVGDKPWFFPGGGKPAEQHKVTAVAAAGGGNITLTLDANFVNTIAAGRFVWVGNGRVSGVFRSADFGVTWKSLGVPADADGTISPGGQANTHLSLLADKANANIVYIGGDRQIFPNTNGATNFTGRLLKGTVGALVTNWTPITDNQATGGGATKTAPHADSRVMVYDANNDILEGDDGGIFKLDNPGANQIWRSANGNLRLTELYAVAWDATNDRIIGGAQDNGVAYQSATGSTSWASQAQGDGGIVQADGSTLLFSTQNFGGFKVGGSAPDLAVVGTIAGFLGSPKTLASFDGTIQFVQPYVLNAVDPDRMLIGTSYLYETEDTFATDLGDVLFPLGGVPLPSGGSFTPNPTALVGKVRAMVYGGKEGATSKPDVGYVGTEGDAAGNFLFVRQAGKNTKFVPVASWKTASAAPKLAPNSKVVAVAADPTDWRKVYVLDDKGRIWFSADGAADPTNNALWTWSELTNQTNNLLDLPGARNLRSLNIFRTGTKTVILVGAEGGLFRRIDDGASKGMWTEFGGGPAVGGGGLPNAPVTDIDIVTKTTTNDTLLVATLGRGAWTAPTADLATPGVLTVTGTAGADVLKIRRDKDKPWLVNVYNYAVGTTPEPAPVEVVPLASLSSIKINSLAGNDQIVVDYSNGAISVPDGIGVDGGADTDTLSLTGSATGKKGTSKKTTNAGPVFQSLITTTDAFGDSAKQLVVWQNTTIETPPVVAALGPSVDGLGTALASASGLFNQGATSVLRGHEIAGINAQSLAAGLNGIRAVEFGPKEDEGEAEGVAESPIGPDEEEQVENAGSILERILQGGIEGFDLTDVDSEGGVIDDPAKLRQALDDLDDVPNNVTLDTTTDVDGDGVADTTLTVHIVDRELEAIVDLDVDASSPLGAVHLSGEIEVQARVDVNLVIGVDGDGFFLKPSTAGQPAISLSHFEIVGEVEGDGRLGFLGVELEDASLEVDPDVHLDLSLRDPGTDAADGVIRPSELSPADFSDLIHVDVVGDPGDSVPDVTLTGDFGVSALLPGMGEAIDLAEAELSLTWADLGDPSTISISATGTAGGAFLDFMSVTSQQVLDGLKDLRGALDTLSSNSIASFDLPMLRGGLDSVIDVVEGIDNKLIKPLSGGTGVNAEFGTLQDLAVRLAGELGISLEDVGLEYSNGELTYHVDFSHTFDVASGAVDLDLSIADGLSLNTFGTTASLAGRLDLDFVFGIDIAGIAAGGDVLDNIFIRGADGSAGPSFSAAAQIDVDPLNAGARLGFIDVNVAGGVIHADPSITMILADPKTNADDGRIDISELLGAPGSVLSTPVLGGTAHAALPLAVNALGLNIAAGADTTVTVDVDFAQGADGVHVTLPDSLDFGKMFSFTNIDAGSLVGLLGKLTFWLDQFKSSDTFKNFDLPLIGPALDKVLGFADAFRDKLLIDDNDNGLDGPDTLLNDINAALSAAGLGDTLRAENTAGNQIKLVATDSRVTSFTVTGGVLGFGASQTSSGTPASITAAGNASATIGSDATFTVKIPGRADVVVKLEAADTTDNKSIGDDKWKLVDADNAPTFSSVQELVLKLNEIFGGNTLAYDPAAQTLTFSLNLAETFGQLDLPVNFNFKDLEPLLALQSSGNVRLTASGTLDLTIGVYLGNTPSSELLTGAETLTDLNGGVQVKPEQVVTGTNDVAAEYGQLPADAKFKLFIDGDATGVEVTVTKSSTSTNKTVADLVADVQAALSAAGVTKVVAVADGLRVVLKNNGAASFKLTAGSSDPAVRNLGFSASADAADDGGVLKIKAKEQSPNTLGRLSSDASFTVTLVNVSPVTVTVDDAVTQANVSMADVVSDVQKALDATSLSGKVKVGNVGRKLTFTTTEAGATLLKVAASGPAATVLGLGANVSGNSYEFYITTHDGNRYGVSLDGVTDLNGVINAIHSATNTHVTATIDSKGTGLKLVDDTFGGPGSAIFKVEAANGSTAAADLGILGVDAPAPDPSVPVDPNAPKLDTPNGILDGASIAGIKITDRFFIQTANVSVNLTLATPEAADDGDADHNDGLDASANIGFFGIGLEGGGTASATFSLGLQDPGTPDKNGTPVKDGRISLTELINGLKDISTLVSAPALTGTGKFAMDVHIQPFPGLDLGAKPQVVFDLKSLGDPFFESTLKKANYTRLSSTQFTLDGDFTSKLPVKATLAFVLIDSGGFKVVHEAKVTASSFANGKTTVTLAPVDASGPAMELPASLTGADFDSATLHPSVEITLPDLGDLLDFKNLDFNFANIIKGLKSLAAFLQQFEAFGFLSQPLPLVNVSVNDLIGVAEKFATAVDQAQANPVGTIQSLENTLKDAFGIPKTGPGSNLLHLELVNDDNDTADTADDFQILKVAINLSAAFDKALSLDFDLGGALSLGGAANVNASGGINLELDLGLNLKDPTQVYLFDSTALTGTLNVLGNALSFHAAAGPLGVFVAGGTVDIHGTVDGTKLFKVDLSGGDYVNHRALVTNVASGLGSAFVAQVGASVAAKLPVFFPTDSIKAGNVRFEGTIGFDSGGGGFTHGGRGAYATDKTDTNEIPFTQLFAFDPAQLSVLDGLLLGVDGIDTFLGGLQDVLDGEVFGFELPLIGDKLSGAADVIGDFRANFIPEFRNALESLANPAAAFNAVSPDGVDPVSRMLFNLLGPAGLKLLKDGADAGTDVGPGDIVFVSNIRTPGVAAKDLFFSWDFHLGGKLVDAGAGIGFDIGIPGLGLSTTGAVKVDVLWDFAFGFGVNATDGFYLNVADSSELQIDVDVTIPGGGIKGTLGFLQLEAKDNNGNTHLGASFGINILNRSNPADQKLGFAELGRIGVDAGIAAEAKVDLGAKLSLSSDLVPNASTNFPTVVADFLLDWGIGTYDHTNHTAHTYVSLGNLGGGFLGQGLKFVGFKHVGLDLGTYFAKLITPIVEKVQDIVGPVKPILDFLSADIPVISDLAGPTSLLDIAAMSGSVNPALIKALEVIDQIVDIVDALDIKGTDQLILYFDSLFPSGTFSIYDQNDPAKKFDLTNPNLDLSGLAKNLKWLPADLQAALGAAGEAVGDAVKGMLPGGAQAGGFKLPIIDDPSQLFGMLLGKPAVLVEYDMAPFKFAADFSAFFSIFGPLGVSINAEFSANIDFDFGYDTRGVQDFAASGFRNPELLFNGFFVNDLDAAGKDVAELQFNAGLWAAAELNLGIARGGVGGGLFAEINFDLHDPDHDGRVRLPEIAANFLNEFEHGSPVLAPLAVFDVTGSLLAKLFAFLKIKLGFFSLSKTFDLTPEIELLSFNIPFTRVPTLATDLGDGVLQLNMGKFAGQRVEGNKVDGSEDFNVISNAGGDLVVTAFGVSQVYRSKDGPWKKIVALGGEGDDKIDLSGVSGNVGFEIDGGAGDDTIKAGTAATGTGRIFGGAGNDDITGGGGADLIFGEAGNDAIHGGKGNDQIFGDGSPKDTITGDTAKVVAKATDGDDTLFGDDDNDLLVGGGGADQVRGGAGDDTLLGDGGQVTLAGGVATDVKDTDDGKGAADKLFGEAGNDRLFGGAGNDSLEGGTDADTIYGESGADAIEGDDKGELIVGGDDTVYAGDDNDTVNAGAGNDKVYGGDGHDTVNAGRGDDRVEAGTGSDTVHGNAGNDTIYGNADPDQLFGDDGNDYVETGAGDDTALGGAGNDTLVGGYGSDVLDGGEDGDSYLISSRGGATTQLTTAYDSGTTGTDIMTVMGTAFDDTFLLRAMADYYDAAALTKTAFVALLNNGGKNVERFNYREMEGLVLNTVSGDDYVVLDDVIAATTINLGLGADRAQVGQVFHSERDTDPLTSHVAPDDVFATLAITRGFLSRGISVATTVNGGDGNDEFTVFHNVAALNLNGGDGDDLFVVRAFALTGSTDSERGRTDMKGDAGADTILYVVNAPVGIDGGDGFDTVRIIGTEFADDFVVTDAGVFGAGLNVSYVNIEKLVADGAEGDDRFFVLSTGLEVITELDGGLGSDSFFVGGNPSGAPIPVTSDDFKGHSGVILHSIETGDPAFSGKTLDGVSANVADDEEDFVVVTQSDGTSGVTEGATGSEEGWDFDTYTIRLTRAPGAGQLVKVAVVAAGLSPEDKARGYADLEFWDDRVVGGQVVGWVDAQRLPELVLDGSNWNTGKQVKFRAVSDAASEGTRFAFINHTVSNSTDPEYKQAKLLSVKVQINDDDRAGVVVKPTGTGNAVLEGGFTDTYDVVLTRKPDGNVTVNLGTLNDQLTLSATSLTFTPGNWDVPQKVTITAKDDATIEGLHTDYITTTVVSAADKDKLVGQSSYVVDGDFDVAGDQPIPIDKATSFVFLKHRPDLSQAVTITLDADDAGPGGAVTVQPYNGEADTALRYQITGNTLSFFKGGNPALVSGRVEASYQFVRPGYDGATVKDAVVDVYDNDTGDVIITQSAGSTDVAEGGFTDSYEVVLSRQPTVNVTVHVGATATRASYLDTATKKNVTTFEKQVEVSLDGSTWVDSLDLVFTPGNWNAPRKVYVRAKQDNFRDGSDTQVFAPGAQTVNKIRGPLLLEGAAGAGSLSLPATLVLPGEIDLKETHGTVSAFQAGAGAGAVEFMTVKTSDLAAHLSDVGAASVAGLVGKTIELAKGPGTGVVLDAGRPRDLFDRFWLIVGVEDLGGGLTRLKFQNPTLVNPSLSNVTAPVGGVTTFALSALSQNFFADERNEVDYTFVYDNDSVGDDSGALTSADGAVLAFAPVNASTDKMTVKTADLLALGLVGNDVATLVGKKIGITVGPGLGGLWTITAVADGAADGTKVLTLAKVTAGAGSPTDRSEFRVEGGDTKGRIIGFGMGPNVVIGDNVRPGGISYGDMEVVQVNLGSGNDTVRVDYTTHSNDHTTRRSGVYYTLTTLNTGSGNDTVNVRLDEGEDGAFTFSGQGGNDTLDATQSTLGVVAFGLSGNDRLTGGAGKDILFGDGGRVDYVRADGTIVTRLGNSLPLNPVNPPVGSATSDTLTDSLATFETQYGGLVGLVVQVISPSGHVQFRTITANDAHTLTVSQPWDETPDGTYFYRIAMLPEDQTDGVVRGPRIAWSIDTNVGGNDTINAGAGDDIVIGGAGDDTIDAGAGNDAVAGDDARFDFTPVSGNDGPTRLQQFTTSTVAGKDSINAGDGNDVVAAGLGDDAVHGNAGDDLLLGDSAKVTYAADGVTPVTVDTTDRANGGSDRVYGDAGDDLVIGGAKGDALDGGAGRDLVLGDNASLVLHPGSGDMVRPRYRSTTGGAIYDANGQPVLGGNATTIPGGLPAWADWTVTLDSAAANSGDDSIAGGAGDDELFGQLGNDTIQGDGSIDLAVSATSPSVEDYAGAGTDGDDYVEGNGGADVIYGDLGQDDLIGGSSGLFSYNLPSLRGDGSDVIFGGAGTRVARNDPGSTATDGTAHGRDADFILGDNGNVFRLVDGSGALRRFNYDNYGTLKLVPRAVQHLDYTFGGNAATDIGAADLLHGEGGDDSVYGTVGNDVLFGEGQDDDLYGGTGSDRIYGGTGEDGILGDDGLLLTTRNGLTEPLQGLNAANAQVNIAENGPFTGAWIYITGRLNKAAAFVGTFTKGGNDVIYGGLGDDFLHGGAGNDGISGAEATAAFYNPNAVTDVNPLKYDPATRKLAGYDANLPLKRIDGHFLNFDAVDGVNKIEDGKDRIFGDDGHDWLVGGTGRDRVFGGAGDDMLNVDDNLDTAGGLNTQPDVPLFADPDFAFGGDGLDVLIANTGGDRLYDWRGEFNTYVVPFNPFGEPTVTRSSAPAVRAFLTALGSESGADARLAEPAGELGLSQSGDNGGPRDPQGPNAKARRDTQGAPEDDRATALPLGIAGPAPAAKPASAAATIASNSRDVTVDNIVLAPDPSDPARRALFVGGSNADDAIEVRRGSSLTKLRVVINGVDKGEFDASNLSRVIVYGNAGNDSITINADAGPITAVLYGGDGNDTIVGGAGNNLIDGGAGNDTITGASGNDVLVGGDGADVIEGNRGDDILIAGSYLESGDLSAASAVMAAWTRTTTNYDARVAALKGGVAAGGIIPLANSGDPVYRLDASTVFNDSAIDVLNGTLDQDWFIASVGDRTDKKGNETLTLFP